MSIALALIRLRKNVVFVLFAIAAGSHVDADILISKLDDITISASAGQANDIVVTNRFCVASDPVGPYSLEALGSGVNNAFAIQNGPYDILFEVLLRDQRTGGGFRPLVAGVPLTGLLTRPLRRGRRCPGNTARLRIIIRSASLQSAASGFYRGSLQLTVIPE